VNDVRLQSQSEVESVIDGKPEPEFTRQASERAAIGITLACRALFLAQLHTGDAAASGGFKPASELRLRYTFVINQSLQAQVHGAPPAAWLTGP
jgi:hypothetical protein